MTCGPIVRYSSSAVNVRSLKFYFAQGFVTLFLTARENRFVISERKEKNIPRMGTVKEAPLMHDELCGVALQIYEGFKQGLLNYATSVGSVTRSLIGAARKGYFTHR
jgi:hypothetical protein